MSLYRVKVQCEFVVSVDDPADVKAVALQPFVDDGIFYEVVESSKIYTKYDLPLEWTEECLPYSRDNNGKTIGKHLAEMNAGHGPGIPIKEFIKLHPEHAAEVADMFARLDSGELQLS